MGRGDPRAAGAGVARHAAVARRLKVTRAEGKAWHKAADNIYIPYDAESRLHKQASQFIDHERWDFSRTRSDQYPLFLHFPYFDLYRRQVVTHAALVLAMHLCGAAFTAS